MTDIAAEPARGRPAGGPFRRPQAGAGCGPWNELPLGNDGFVGES
ncbi:hypothetical protein ABZ479_39255 [Streptomyces sp. NPDC005722]